VKKVWLAQYPEGVPAEVDVRKYASLKDVLEQSCTRFPQLTAYSNLGADLRYADLARLSRDFAAYLQHELGLQKGCRVAVMMPNLLQYPVVLFGVLRAGLTVVNVNPQYTARELEHQLRDSGAAAVVVLENAASTLAKVLDKTQVRAVVTTQVGDLLPLPRRLLVNFAVKHLKHMVPRWRISGARSFNQALRLGRSHTLSDVTLTHDDVAFLQYTGGTTGVAKGAVLTHGNMVANVLQVGAWIGSVLGAGRDTAVIPLPLYHVYALTSCLVFTHLGVRCVLITDPRDMPAFIQTLRTIRLSAIIGVNTLYRALLDAPGFAGIDLSQLKLSAAGGMAVQRIIARRWKEATGKPLNEGYGMSETSPLVISNPIDIEDWTGATGVPIPSTEAAILDDDGRPVGTGDVGEICVRGPQVMTRYWNNPAETQRAFTAEGWFRTGDMGVMDVRGYFTLTDRKKDMIIVSGFKVFPNEIEDVVMLHPGVLEVGAIGTSDAQSGESVKLVVVKRDPGLTEQALIEHCRKHLTGYKVPKQIEFRQEALPKTPVGKILRRQLRQPAAAAHPSPA